MGTTRDGSTRVIMRQRPKASKAEDHIKRAPCVRRPLFPLRVRDHPAQSMRAQASSKAKAGGGDASEAINGIHTSAASDGPG